LALRQRRIGWLFGVFAALLAIAAIRALQLTTLNAGSLSSAANAEHAATVTIPAARGAILDRNGVMLAVTQSAYDITATPRLVKNASALALELAPILHRSATALETAIAHPTSSSYYTVLAHQVPADVAQQVRALKVPGVDLTADPRRIYPDGDVAAQVLGGVGAAGNGLGGIELEFNKDLRGTPGVQPVVYDGAGRPIHVTGTTAVAGKTVQLTIDAALEQYTDSVVAATGERYHALHATAIVLDPNTDAVLAMSNWPRVNANDPSAVGVAQDYATSLNYEPGSTFKVVAIGGALSDGLITPRTPFTIPYEIHVADRTIHDSDYHPTEVLTTRQILAQSSNVGAVKIGERLGDAAMYRWMLRFGFGAPTGIDLPGEEAGEVPALSQWSGSSIGNLPIGQGLDVTPMQLAAAYSAIANGGILRTPHIVESVGGVATPSPRPRRILSPLVSAELRRMLEAVTSTGGTASEIHIPSYVLAGKTGTAQKVVHGTYSEKYYYASFVGFAPAHAPKLEAIVMVDSPVGAIYGTEVAAPAWQKIMQFALTYLKVPPR
jgi:cell division protein FtsI (penicillin-binding protein 3)/stage V sporulation protein D (sporulation-specific penicillin-binding protein)